MNLRTNHFLIRLTAFAAALFGAAVAPVQAQTINNTATIEWDAGTARISRPSNPVQLTVTRPVPGPATMQTFQFEPNGSTGVQTMSVPETLCQTSSGSRPIALGGAFVGTNLSNLNVAPAHAIRAGEPLVIHVTSSSDNQNSNIVETKTVTLTTPSGDRETLTLTENGPNTGVFVGIINTAAIPPQPVQGDCRLSLYPGESLTLTGLDGNTGAPIASAPLEVLVDPFGIVFDSGDGAPVPGSKVTLIDVATGQPAQVFGDDGVSSFPSTVVTGSTVTDSSGTQYAFPPGDYRFPFVRPGQYRLLVVPPAPYTAPSTALPADLAHLLRPDGQPYTIVSGSYSNIFTINNPSPVRVDIPVDKPGAPLTITKTVNQPVAVPGDTLQYTIIVRNSDNARPTGAITISDRLPDAMRLVPDTVRLAGVKIPYMVTNNGREITINISPLGAAKSAYITYLVQVRPDAQPGHAANRAQASDNRGVTSPVVDAFVRISRDGMSDRMTIIGRVTEGGCTVDPRVAKGIGGVRVMLEDGSYSVTDVDGRYHFEGVNPGIHVVQFDPSTLPVDQVPANCTDNARSGGSAISRFVEGRGGALLRVDFRSMPGENKARQENSAPVRPVAVTSADAAGANRDWLTGQAPGVEWVFPESDHNPRTKAVRVAIKHRPGQIVRLLVNGTPVNPLALDGTKTSADGQVAVTIWRAVEIQNRDTQMVAEVLDANGAIVETLRRTVHFSASPMQAKVIREKSHLVADGVTRPVIAVQFIDRDGRLVHAGLTGDFGLTAPYQPAVEVDAQAARQLAGLERARPVWHVEGDDGIAYIELEPTTASGTLGLTLPLRDGDVSREERINLWMDAGKRPWTVVGFGAGTVGFNTVARNLEKLAPSGESWYSDARIALYAKGRIKGKWLMTLAYDSAKNRDDTRFGGVIDPSAYYTIYADRSERRYDAASERKLYLKLERPQFYALFGDYETGISEPQLARYSRAFNGIKSEYRSEKVGITAFAADTPFRHRREEIQGNGLSGPYALAARDILPNSERITIETRDRLSPTRIIDTKVLVRHIDYDIDYVQGSLRFREPILSRSSALDPQFIVADYEVDGVAQRTVNAGGRVTWTNTAKSLTVGLTGVHDEDEAAKTNLGGLDVRYRPSQSTEIRAEVALSDRSAKAGAAPVQGGSKTAWLVEAEHHSKNFDVLATARQQDGGFGVGQTNGAGDGTRRYSVDGRARIAENLSVLGTFAHTDQLNTAAKRDEARAMLQLRTNGVDVRAGVTAVKDKLADGRSIQSTIAQAGVTKRFFDNKLEIDAQTELAIGKQSDSIDFPTRHVITARYNVSNDIALIGGYEIADGKSVNARTARVGFDVKPWAGGKMIGTVNKQDIAEYGPRTYAAFGLAQSLPIGKHWTTDFTLDANKTLQGVDASKIVNVLHPVASGGFVGNGGLITEDFTAITAGATYRDDRWSWNARAEARDGSLSNRLGFSTAILRQVGEGEALGGQFLWARAEGKGATIPTTESASLALSWAHRPADSRFSLLNKLEFRSDKVTNAIYGQPGPTGGPALLINGSAVSQRIINSLSMNWSPVQKTDDEGYQTRSEISFFWGARYVKDQFGDDDIKGLSNVVGADFRLDVGKRIDLGLSATVRQNPGGRAMSFSGGPSISISPITNSYITIGYNVVGFRDRDFQDSRYTQSGPYITLRLKFDQNSFGALGLGGKK